MKKEKSTIDSKKIKEYFNYFQMYFFKYFIISLATIIFLILFVLWVIGTFTICGDGYCTAKECNSGCSDCSPEDCTDNTCQPQVKETCQNSPDCVCDINQVCAIERSGTDNKGCYNMKCGDGFCDAKGENKESCCLDCGCNSGYSCNQEKNECQFLTPELGITTNYITKGVSASSLYSNRELIDESGKKHALVSIKISNNGTNLAKNIVLSLKIGQYTIEQKESIGELQAAGSKDYDWYPTATENMLKIKDNENVLINIVVNFEDEHGKKYTSAKGIPIIIVGKNNWGTYSSVSQYVTPIDSVVRQAVSSAGSFSTREDPGIQEAAREIWDLLNGLRIDYISDPTLEYRQYPAEVFMTKKGDCDDLATLYVALLESVGVKTALITHPGHMYAAYYDSQYIYPVETTMLTSSFDDAYNAGLKEYDEHKNDREVVQIEEEWKNKNIQTPGYIGIDAKELSFPNIEVRSAQSSEWLCSSQNEFGCLDYNLVVYCDLTFINSGTSEGQKCVNLLIKVDDYLVQTKVVCENVGVNDREESRTTYTDTNHANAPYTYRCVVE